MKRIVEATIIKPANSYTCVRVDGESADRPLDPWHGRITHADQRVRVAIWPDEHLAYLVAEADR